jgi:hypothetical protein
MKTYPLKDEQDGYPSAFEIENVYVGPRAIGRLLKTIDGVSDVRVRRMFGKWEDIHVWFKYRGRNCVVWEPYGDNSRYWIGPQDAEREKFDVSGLEGAFKAYRPPLHRQIIGDVLTLRVLKRLVGRA